MTWRIYLSVTLALAVSGGSAAAQETLAERVQRTRSITVVADRENLPYASETADNQGIDIDIARAIAQELDIRIYYRWINTLYENPLNEIIRGNADLAVGVALDVSQLDDDKEQVGDRVLFTSPMYATGYVAVGKPGLRMPASFRKLTGKIIGVERGSLAQYTLRDWGLNILPLPNQMAILLALKRGQVDVGALWADAGYLLKEHDSLGLRIAQGYAPESELRVNIGAAVPRTENAFAKTINDAILRLIEAGTVQTILKKYGVPYFPPME